MMEIIDCIQGTEGWYRARLGLLTASNFQTILVPIGPKGGIPAGRKTLLYKLAGELVTGELMDNYENDYMKDGKDGEEEARDYYAFQTDATPERVGFIRNGPKGCSPDALIGNNGVLEIKRKVAHLMVELLLKDEFPSEHVAQTQGNLWVTEREWIDLAIYHPKMPMFLKRSYRNEVYIAKLSAAVDRFNAELHETVEKIRRYGAREMAA